MGPTREETMRLVSRRYNWLRNSRLTSLELAAQTRLTPDIQTEISPLVARPNCPYQLIDSSDKMNGSDKMHGRLENPVDESKVADISHYLQTSQRHVRVATTTTSEMVESTRRQTSINQTPRARRPDKEARAANRRRSLALRSLAMLAYVTLLMLTFSGKSISELESILAGHEDNTDDFSPFTFCPLGVVACRRSRSEFDGADVALISHQDSAVRFFPLELSSNINLVA